MSYFKDQIKERVKPQFDELTRTAKSVLGYHKSADELVAERNYTHYLVIDHAIQTGQDNYIISDTASNAIYKVKGTAWLGRHRLIVHKENEKIGEIRKKLVVLPDLIDGQTERHMCLVYHNGNEVNCVEAYTESQKQKFKIHKHGWKVSYNPDNDSYVLRQQKNIVAQLNEACNNKYVIGYNDLNKEVEIVMLAIAFFQINNVIMNK